jgi:dihydrofolate reductase
MRKLIVTNIVSLDGYHEGPGGDVMALPLDHSFDAYNAERLRAADTLLLGRNTYDGFKSFWPRQADNTDPALVEALAGDQERLATIREISRLNNAIEKVVVSDSLTEDDTDPWRDTTRIVRRSEAHQQIAELKQRSGGDILVFGSRTLWNDLLAAGLVDELHIMVGCVILGDGTPAFSTPAPLRLLGARTFDGSDNILVRYAASQPEVS